MSIIRAPPPPLEQVVHNPNGTPGMVCFASLPLVATVGVYGIVCAERVRMMIYGLKTNCTNGRQAQYIRFYWQVSVACTTGGH